MEYDPLESNTHAIKMIMHNIMSQFHQENMISNFLKNLEWQRIQEYSYG